MKRCTLYWEELLTWVITSHSPPSTVTITSQQLRAGRMETLSVAGAEAGAEEKSLNEWETTLCSQITPVSEEGP